MLQYINCAGGAGGVTGAANINLLARLALLAARLALPAARLALLAARLALPLTALPNGSTKRGHGQLAAAPRTFWAWLAAAGLGSFSDTTGTLG